MLLKLSEYTLSPRVYRRLLSRDIQSSRIKITPSLSPKSIVPKEQLIFGKSFTDHMLTIEYDGDADGWKDPEIRPYAPLQLDPSASVLHYGLECFEGMKAYKDKKGKVRLFRPDMNMNRFYKSSTRLCLPSFDKNELRKCIEKLVLLDKRWIPHDRGYSLYIRPTMIATQNSLGVGASSKALLFVICSPVGPYYKTGFSAVSLLADPTFVRAWPGGVGDYKVGGNYAPTILTQMNAAAEGFQQILWLLPHVGDDHQTEHLLTEVGTMNLFVLMKAPDGSGKKHLVTPELDGTILPGITRDSIIKLVRDDPQLSDIEVHERKVSMKELLAAKSEGRLLEMFGSGTAAIVSPVRRIRYVEKRDPTNHSLISATDIDIPLDPNDKNSQAGPLAKYINDLILSIQYGEKHHDFSVILG